jgi:hypothetical protein
MLLTPPPAAAVLLLGMFPLDEEQGIASDLAHPGEIHVLALAVFQRYTSPSGIRSVGVVISFQSVGVLSGVFE